METKFVYLARVGKYYKIGSTGNIKKRLAVLQASNPRKVHLIIAAVFVDYKDVEKTMQKRFQKKRVSGEWFELSKEDVSFIFKMIEFLHYHTLRKFKRDMTWKKAMKNVVRGENVGEISMTR